MDDLAAEYTRPFSNDGRPSSGLSVQRDLNDGPVIRLEGRSRRYFMGKEASRRVLCCWNLKSPE